MSLAAKEGVTCREIGMSLGAVSHHGCNREKSPRETALDDESDIACNVLAPGVDLLAEQSGDDWRARVFLYRRWANSSTVARTSENT